MTHRRSAPNDKSRPSDQPPAADGSDAAASEEGGLSLDALSDAFTAMLNSGADPYSSPEEQPEPAEAAADTTSAADAEVTPRTILEAMLFVGYADNAPLEPQRVAELMRGVTATEIEQLAQDLNEQYIAENRPYRIRGEGSGFRLVLDERFASLRERFYGRVREARLSQAAVEVLSIVAYNQPITRHDVERLRDRPSRSVLTQLVRRQLLAIERDPENRRVVRYRTTERFLQLFGLESINDLPRAQDVQHR